MLHHQSLGDRRDDEVGESSTGAQGGGGAGCDEAGGAQGSDSGCHRRKLALNHGHITIARLSMTLAGLPLPRLHKAITVAVDVSSWLRPDAATSSDRAFCHVYGRGRSRDQYIPGWPYQVIVALGSGRSSWTAPLDVMRLHPDQDATAASATQIRSVYHRLRHAGQHHDGEPDCQ